MFQGSECYRIFVSLKIVFKKLKLSRGTISESQKRLNQRPVANLTALS